MFRFLYISIILLIFSEISISQINTTIVDKIAKNICNQLDTIKNIDNITAFETKKIITDAISKNKQEWNKELDKIENSRLGNITVFHYLLRYRLQQNCENFRIADNKLDQYMSGNEKYRTQYLKAKEFVLAAEINKDVSSLTHYFSSNLNQEKLIQKLKNLKIELEKYKNSSGLIINGADYFHASIFDYISGIDNIIVMILFDDSDEILIKRLEFKTKKEIEEDRKKEKEINLDDIPMPPHAP
ncbi:MAG: hypothetical protein JXR51_04415 [Bacteroidales bacterium]|nr:hypothetical protein [Bacteroidales bacterium]